MQYHRAWWYDLGTGRFTALDPFDGIPARPATLNKYAYAGNDPVNGVDPSGKIGIGLASFSFGGLFSSNLQQQRIIVAGGQVYRANAALRRIAVGSVKQLKALKNGGQGIWKDAKGVNEEIHHLIEQRLWRDSPQLQRLFKSADDIPGAVLKSGEHQIYTNRWLSFFARRGSKAYKSNLTIDEIIEAAFEVYKDQPAMLKAILLAIS